MDHQSLRVGYPHASTYPQKLPPKSEGCSDTRWDVMGREKVMKPVSTCGSQRISGTSWHILGPSGTGFTGGLGANRKVPTPPAAARSRASRERSYPDGYPFRLQRVTASLCANESRAARPSLRQHPSMIARRNKQVDGRLTADSNVNLDDPSLSFADQSTIHDPDLHRHFIRGKTPETALAYLSS